MTYNYKIVNFDPQQGTIAVEFEGYQATNFMAPFLNGAYLTGQALDDYIQTLYPQVLLPEERMALVSTITGGEALTALLPPPVIATTEPPLVISVEPVKSVYNPGETIDAVITFDKPITLDTYLNIKLDAGPLETVYLPSATGATQATLTTLKAEGKNAESLEMFIGNTTANYTGPKYPGGVNFRDATISAKTMLNGLDRQDYVTSSAIGLIDETIL